MKMPMLRWLALFVAVVVVVGLSLAIPAWAASNRQPKGPGADAYAAMHEVCVAGNSEGMKQFMESLSGEDSRAMREHMGDGHNDAMGPHMSGMRSMMNGRQGHGMMGMGGMMPGGSGRGMMGP